MKRRIKEMLSKKNKFNVGAYLASARGITLIALVITIIILIILAGVTINLTLGDNGIFKKAETAKIETKRSQIRELLDLKLVEEKTMDFEADNKTTVEKTRENVIRNKQQLNKLGKEVEIKEVQEENGEVFFYVIVDKDIYKVGLDGTKYIGKQSDEEVELPEGDIIFSYEPSDPTNGNVKVGIQSKKEIEGYKIEYKTATSEWVTYKGEIEVDKNQDIYARLAGIAGQTSVATGTVSNIDKLNPNEFTPEVIETTSNSIKIKAETTDAEKDAHNACSGEIKYLFSKDGGTTWEPVEYQESGEYEFTGLNQTTTYTIKVKAKDKAGNETEGQTTATTKTVTGLQTGDVTFTYTPSKDTKENVKVGITGNTTGYILQYKTEKTGESGEVTGWTEYTGEIEITRNQDIYARTVDSRGQTSGTYATGTVANIDKLKPNEFTPTATSTSNSITVTAFTTDAEKDADNACSGEIKYVFSIDGEKTWEPVEYQESGEYKFTGLNQTTTYTIKVKAKDNAGNEIIGTATATTKTVTGIETGDVTFTYTPSDWTNGNVKVGITGNTTGYILQYKTEKTGESGEVTGWTEYTGEIEITRNQDIYARTVDSRGQTSGTYATGTVSNIDKTPPSKTTVNLNGYTSGDWTNGNVTQSFSATDSESGISHYQYSHDGVNPVSNITNPWVISWDGQWNFYIRAVDNVGNAGAWSDMYTIRRDTAAPTWIGTKPTGSSDDAWGTAVGVGTRIDVAAENSTSGIARFEFSKTNGGSVVVTRTDITSDSNNSWYGSTSNREIMPASDYWVRAVDKAGNASAYVQIAPQKVTGISLNKTSTTIYTGNTETLTATVSPTNAINRNVTWKSSNTGVATVSNGVITAKAAGTATITVTAADGSGKSASCTVTVIDKLYLYNYGDECTDVTGGWTTYKNNPSGTMKATANSDNLYAYTKTSSTTYGGKVAWKTTNLIDISDYNTLNFIVNVTAISGTNGGASCWIGGATTSNNPTTDNSLVSAKKTAVGEYTVSIDISEYSGSYNIYSLSFCACPGTSESYTYAIWLEK